MILTQNDEKKIRLDRFLSENLNASRSQITQLIAKNLIQINGKIAHKSGILLKFNDKIIKLVSQVVVIIANYLLSKIIINIHPHPYIGQ